MLKKIILSLFLINSISVFAGELVIDNDYQVVNSSEVVPSKNKDLIQDEIELRQGKYYYNEPEDDNSKGYIKSKYDFNIGESEMSVGLKGFSIKFPVSKH